MIVDATTGRFLKQDGGWTGDEAEAAAFEDILSLFEGCRRNASIRPEVLLRFDGDPRLDVRFPYRS